VNITRLTDEELNNLAIAIVAGKTYIANQPEAVRFSFSHLIGLLNPPMTEEEAELVGALYEDYSAAGPRGINGYPFFFSLKFLHKDDLGPLHDKIEAKQKALREA
jgi:hypothetical protein